MTEKRAIATDSREAEVIEDVGGSEAPSPGTFWKKLVSRRVLFRRLGWGGVSFFLGVNALASVRFFFPRVLFEPSARFKIGRPSDFTPGTVTVTFIDRFRVWVVRRDDGSFLCLDATCTHLGCTPNWKESERIIHCPCHGSKFYPEGTNFAGPAPRPLDRFKMSVTADGQIMVDRSVKFRGVGGQDSNELYPQSLLRV